MKQKRLDLAEKEVVFLMLTIIKYIKIKLTLALCFFQYTYLMSKWTGEDGPQFHDDAGNVLTVPVKAVTSERTVVTTKNICATDDSDRVQDELSEQIANSRSRVSLANIM